MVDLKVTLGEKLTLQNPILSASGTFGYGDELPELVDVNELGGLITKSLTRHPREGHPPPRIAETPAGMLNAIGLANIGVERFCAEKLPYLNGLKTAVVASVAGSTLAEYLEVVEYIEASDPDIAGYEINISCPNVKEGGMEFGISARITEELTARLRPLSDRLLMVKLSPNVTSISDIARGAEQGGADAVCAINTVVGMGVDPRTGKFLVSSGLAGLSGPAIRPIAVAAVYEVARAVTIPVIGVGGIMNGADAISFVRAGAWAVQIGTANYRDPATGVKVVSQLRALMEELGVGSLAELRGSAAA